MSHTHHTDNDGTPARKPLAPRNFLTSPPKRGTYGMVGMNIGGKVDGIVGELAYSPNPPPPKTRPSTTSDLRAFCPSSPPKRGTYGIMNRLPARLPACPTRRHACTHKQRCSHARTHTTTRAHTQTNTRIHVPCASVLVHAAIDMSW